MKPLVLALATLLAASGGAGAQDPVPETPTDQAPAVPAPAPAVAPPPGEAPAAVRAVDAATLVAEVSAYTAASLARLREADGRDLSPPVAAEVDRLLADHARLDDALRAAAGDLAADAATSGTVPGETGALAPADGDLAGLAGADYEAALVDRQADALSTAMRSLTGYVESGDRPDLVAFAADALATLQEHQAALAALRP